MGDGLAVECGQAVVIIVGGGECRLLEVRVQQWSAEAADDLPGSIVFKQKKRDEFSVGGFPDGCELAGRIVGDLVGGAVWADGAGESAEPIVGVGGRAVRPIGDGGEEVPRVVNVGDFLAAWVLQVWRIGEFC